MGALRSAAALRLDLDQRIEFVRLKAFGLAMYGVEVAQPALDALASFAAAATDFLHPKAAWCKSPVLALTLLNRGPSLWPETRIMVLRVLAFRKARAKDPRAADDMLAALR